MKKTIAFGIGILVLFGVFDVNAALEQAGVPSPPMPGVFWGTAILDGNNVSVGDVVTAYDSNGTLCGNFTVNTEGYYGYLGVKGDNLNTTNITDDEGAIENDTITFYINGIEAGTGVWNEGEIKRVDLSAIPLPIGDFNGDGCVDMTDFAYWVNHYGETPASPGWNDKYDLYDDDKIDMTDFAYWVNHYGEGCPW